MKHIVLLLALCATAQVSTAQRGYVEKSIHDKQMKEHGEPGMAKLQEFMDNMNNAKTKERYDFPMSFVMHMTSYDKGVKKDERDIHYYANGPEQLVAFDGTYAGNKEKSMKDSRVVYDNKNASMIMLNEKDKTYTAMNINAFRSKEMQEKAKNPGSNIDCKKTGNTKTIRGYACEEYVCVDEEKDTRSEMWVTNKIAVNMAGALKGNSPMKYGFSGLDNMNGMLIEGKFYKKDKLEATIETTNIDTKANYSISLGTYKKQDMFNR